MIGTKLYKNTNDIKQYSKYAIWCNNNNSHIEDKGEYYEIVENQPIELTIEEKTNKIISQYKESKQELIQYIIEANIYNEDITELKNELHMLDEQFDKEIKELQGE